MLNQVVLVDHAGKFLLGHEEIITAMDFSGTLWAKVHNRFRRHVLGDPINGIELHAAL